MKKNLTLLTIGLLFAFAACNKASINKASMEETEIKPDSELETTAETIYTPDLDDAQNILLNATGYNPKFMNETEPWEQTAPQDFLAGSNDSKTNITRYPGGTWGSYFDFDHNKMFPKLTSNDPDGWVNTSKISNSAIANNISNDAQKVNSVNDLKYAVSNSGKTINVVYQMNMITPGWDYYHKIHPNWASPIPGSTDMNDTWYKMLDDRYDRFKRMLLRAKSAPNALTVRFIELGNEYYFGDDYQVEAFRGGGDFGKASNYIANKLINDNDLNLPSTVRIAATASCVTGSTRAENWNANLENELDRNLVGYITLHVYKKFTEPTIYNETNFQNKLVDWYQAVNQKFINSNADAIFVSPSAGIPWKVWYTETNANWDGASEDNKPVDQRTWAQSIVEAYSAQYLYDRGNASMYLQFQFNNQVRNNSDIISGLRLYNRALALMPFMEASTDATSAARVSFVGTGIPSLPNSPKAVVSGYCFITSGGNKKCFFINLTGSTKHLNLGAHIFTGGVSNVNVKSYNNTSISTVAVPTLNNNSYSKTDVELLPYSVNYIYQ